MCTQGHGLSDRRDVNRADAAAWDLLRFNWDSAYLFEYDSDPRIPKPFRVKRKDDPAKVLEAETPNELGDMIDEDYKRKPVPREVAP